MYQYIQFRGDKPKIKGLLKASGITVIFLKLGKILFIYEYIVQAND